MLPSQTLPKPGDLVGSKYRIMSSLGAGGMGVVFEAVHIETEAAVAIKWLNPDLSATPTAVERFKIEARATGRIRHPNVVAIHDIGDHEGNVYLVMELLRGESLRARLQRGPCELAEALRILFPVMRGVAAAHAVKVLHRDLKPENIFLASLPDGLEAVPKVLDFGIAKLSWDSGTTSRNSIVTGMMGTYPYMSFEQLHARSDLDGRVDVYALGAVLYDMLTGRLPYEADNPVDLALRMLQSEPEPVTAHVPSLPPELAKVIERALARERDDRYASVDELALALEPFADSMRYRGTGHTGRVVANSEAPAEGASTPPLATPFVVSPTKPKASQPPAPAKSRRPMLYGAGALLGVVLVLLALKLFGGPGEPVEAHKAPPPPALPHAEPPSKPSTGAALPTGNADWDDAPAAASPGTEARPSGSLAPTGTPELRPTAVDTKPEEAVRKEAAEPRSPSKEGRSERRKKSEAPAGPDSELLIPDWAK